MKGLDESFTTENGSVDMFTPSRHVCMQKITDNATSALLQFSIFRVSNPNVSLPEMIHYFLVSSLINAITIRNDYWPTSWTFPTIAAENLASDWAILSGSIIAIYRNVFLDNRQKFVSSSYMVLYDFSSSTSTFKPNARMRIHNISLKGKTYSLISGIPQGPLI